MLIFSSPNRAAARAQFTWTVQQSDYGDVGLLEDHVQAAQHRVLVAVSSARNHVRLSRSSAYV